MWQSVLLHSTGLSPDLLLLFRNMSGVLGLGTPTEDSGTSLSGLMGKDKPANMALFLVFLYSKCLCRSSFTSLAWFRLKRHNIALFLGCMHEYITSYQILYVCIYHLVFLPYYAIYNTIKFNSVFLKTLGQKAYRCASRLLSLTLFWVEQTSFR